MTPQFEVISKISGFVVKKGSGNIEGRDWSHDHLEVHVMTPLNPESEGHGETTQHYNLQGADANFSILSNLIGKEALCTFQLVSKGKGTAPIQKLVKVDPVTKK